MAKLLKNIGEFGLIERIRKRMKSGSLVVKGIGDDTAVLKLGKERFLLFTADMLIEGVHFKKNASPEAIGRKAISVSLSDIAAMGGEPKFALVSIGLPATISLGKVDRVYSGIIERARKFKVSIVGGDTVRARQLTINTSVIGEVEKNKLVTRSQAKLNDIIFVSGSLGASGKRNRHLNFTPPLKEARFLVDHFQINSMIDLSDGLFSDLDKICKESKVGAVIFEDLIPLNPQANLNSALYEGEDFKLLFTVAPDVARKIGRSAVYSFFPIGSIRRSSFGLKLVKKGAKLQQVRLADKSFRHFK